MTKRCPGRTWHPTPTAAESLALVQDPAVREILRIVSRSLKAICAAIDRRCGKDAADDG